jgi:hypothetical protein
MCKIIFNGKYNQDIHNASNGHLEKMVEKEREEGMCILRDLMPVYNLLQPGHW